MAGLRHVSDMERLLEAALIRSPCDMYGIYRLNQNPELGDRRGKSLQDIQAAGLRVRREHYILCYIGVMGSSDWVDTIRARLAADTPPDFPGAPPDMGDIIVLQLGGELTAHYLNEFDAFDVLEDFTEQTAWRRKILSVMQIGVEYGLSSRRRTVPGYILEDGTVLLDEERDAAGNFISGAGVDGMHIRIGERYQPMLENGKLIGFYRVEQEVMP